MKLFELSDYIDVLAVVSEADLDLIMVGGNAVSFYAEKYRSRVLKLPDRVIANYSLSGFNKGLAG